MVALTSGSGLISYIAPDPKGLFWKHSAWKGPQQRDHGWVASWEVVGGYQKGVIRTSGPPAFWTCRNPVKASVVRYNGNGPKNQF